MAAAASAKDAKYLDESMQGLGIVGPVAESNVWEPLPEPEKYIDEEELRKRAWDIRRKIQKKIEAAGIGEHSEQLWKKTQEDVQAGFTVGPFYDGDEVSAFVEDEKWICTQRFPVEQKGGVREVDSATASWTNPATQVKEKLRLPNTDLNIGVLKLLGKAGKKLGGWVLDERKAYRSIGLWPGHRKYAVIALLHPTTGKLAYFVMIGHSFGWTAAVYNFNRRARLLDEIGQRLFGLVSFAFFDDKYGFEPLSTVESALDVVTSLHAWLGITFDLKKIQLGTAVTILMVTYDLNKLLVEVTEAKKERAN